MRVIAHWSLLLSFLALTACTAQRGRRGGELDAQADALARQELVALEALAQAQDHAAVVQRADALLDRYPGFESEDRVLLLGGRAALAVSDLRRADRWLQFLVEEFSEGDQAREGWWEIARSELGKSEPARAALAYAGFLSQRDGDEREATALEAFDALLQERLAVVELQALAGEELSAELRPRVEWQLLIRSREQAGSVEAFGKRVADYLRKYPSGPRAQEARELIARLEREHGLKLGGEVAGGGGERIGILCPVTGENAALGQAMYDGALLALEEHNRQRNREVQLVSYDTRGDGVRAVQMARQLIEKDQVVAIIGDLLTHTTVAVATLCQERRVPLISPTATQETIGELGDYVFQTNLTRAIETKLVARAAVELLLRRRFAILHPATEEGQLAAELFKSAVEAEGASVVAVETIERGSTDVRPLLERLRGFNPEAIFTPVTPSEMRWIAPQLTFVGLETQILGPSSWNNSVLAREVGEYLDRAVFPSDIALIPDAEARRFESAWSKRFPGQPSNAFALKSYFALRLVMEGLEAGQRTPASLQRWLVERLKLGGDDLTLGLENLRVIQGGEYVPFPVGDFPRAGAASSDD